MMNPERMTPATQAVIQAAQTQAIAQGHQNLEPAHLALGVVSLDRQVQAALKHLEVDPQELGEKLRGVLTKQPGVSGAGYDARKVYFSSDCLQILARAELKVGQEAKVDPVTLWEELLAARSPALVEVLTGYQLTAERFRSAWQQVAAANAASEDALSPYGRDLTSLARAGKLDPVIGRDEEIQRVVRILSRKTKNNPVLIGEPGVGKTAVAEGLAQRIINHDVPEGLKDRRLFALDISALVAGASYRGEFEQRLKTVLEAISASQGDILLFIDELHTIVGAGKGEGAMDAGNILKPLLARGELHCVGATTLDEYRQYIEKDPALERRFQQVLVQEPGVEDTISILRGLRERFELHHGVRILDRAIVAAATLADRYISDRFLPDKAIDLVDEASARIRTEIDSRPAVLDRKLRRQMRLEIEEAALKKEADTASQERLQELQRELQELSHEVQALSERYEREKQDLAHVRQLRAQLEQTKQDIIAAERTYDLEGAAALQHGKLPELQRKIAAASKDAAAAKRLLREQVDEEEVAQVVHQWTGIPVTKLLAGEKAKLLNLATHLGQTVIGQDAAVQTVADAVLRARAGMQDPERPLGSFLFLGPTGVGKTQLAKSLAACLFEREDHLLRIDMSEYMEKHAVARLLGSPPGYVGHEEGGQLTEVIRRQPYSVLLFDEVEKAHPDVLHVLLQLLDDGRLTDSKGRVVSFKNCVVIMTSNMAAQVLIDSQGHLSDSLVEQVFAALREFFRPEFLNRIDDVVLFKPLGREELTGITELFLRAVTQRLKAQGYGLQVSPAALSHLAQQGYDRHLGARPLKRYLQKNLETPLAQKVIAGDKPTGDDFTVSLTGGELTIT